MMKNFLKLFAVVVLAVSCTKNGPDPTLVIDGKTSYNVTAVGETLNVKFKTNQTSWGYDLGGASWLSATKGENCLTLVVSPSDVYEPRETVVEIFVPEEGADKKSVQVSIKQMAKIFEPELSTAVPSPIAVTAKAQTVPVEVLTNYSTWTFEVAGDWLSATATGNVLNLEIKENTSEDDRSAGVTLYAPNKEMYEIMAKLTVNQAGAEYVYELEDLSVSATSNSYIIKHRGPYSFNASVRGNGKGCTGLDAPSALAPAGAKLVWQSAKNFIQSVEYKEGKIFFEAGKPCGNAVIAATDASGKIIWSWHIWRPEVEISTLKSESGSEMMNINLGALTEDASKIGVYGLLYQWGRKDPFPGSPIMSNGNIYTVNADVYDINNEKVKIGSTEMSSTSSNSLAFSIANPATCISNAAQYKTSRDWLLPSESNNSLWGNPEGTVRKNGTYSNKGTKTFYDPCPVGWRVCDVSDFAHFTSSGAYTWAAGETEGVLKFYDLGGEAEVAIVDLNSDGMVNLKDYTHGWSFYLDRKNKVRSHFPATSRYDGQFAMLMGSMAGYWGNYWTNAPTVNATGAETYLASALAFGIKEYTGEYSISISPVSNGSRADAYSVRCIKE